MGQSPYIHLVQSAYLAPVLKTLRDFGLAVEDIARRTKLMRFNIDDPNAYVPVAIMYDFYESVRKAHDLQFLDFFKDAINVSYLSDDILEWVYSKDLLYILQSACAINRQVVSNENMTLRIDGPRTYLTIIIDERLSAGHEMAIQTSMLFLLDGIQGITGKDWHPLEIAYQFSKPEHEDPFINMGKDVNVRYDMPYSGFVFNTIDLSMNKRLNTGEAFDAASAFNLSESIESLLNSFSFNLIPNLNYFSEMANMSERNFIRKLRGEGTSYFQIIDSWRFKKALILLEDETVKITHLQNMLGYANHSNFERAFKRWTGMTPTAYREILFK